MNNIKMIFGAPGCGKTTFLLHLLEQILEENEPGKVAFVSFTKKGSYEGRDRAMDRFSLREDDLPFFRTIHSLAFRDLGVSRYDMISKRHYKEFSTAMGMNFVGYYTTDYNHGDDRYLFMVSLEKNNKYVFEAMVDDMDFEKFSVIRRNYERYKKEYVIKDYDDLLVEFIDKGESLPVDIAIIDEAQDLTSLQWRFCEVAFKDCKEVYIAGDDDQAIYGWSGADTPYFLNKTKGNDVVVLDKSYRLKKNILELAKSVSKKISMRIPKDFSAVEEGGNIFYHNCIEDIPINSEESYYFLSRNNYFLPAIDNHLMRMGVVFSHKEKPSVNPAILNAIRRYEGLRKSAPLEIAGDKLLSLYLKKDRIKGDPWFSSFNLEINESNYYRDLFKNKTDTSVNRIMVNTIHGVKGGEADNVVVLLDMTKTVYKNLTGSTLGMDSELRCLYVALTRTKKNLHIIHANSKFGYGEIINEVKK